MLKFALDTFMKEEHLSIQDVVDATGISRPTISQLSDGKSKGIQFDTLDRLVSGLGIDLIDDLFEDAIAFKDLRYGIILSDNYKELLDNEYEVAITAGFYSPENSNKEFTITSFKIPMSVEFASSSDNNLDTIIFSCNNDFLFEESIPQRNQFNLQSFLTRTNTMQLEHTLGNMIADCLEALGLQKKYNTAIFKTDIDVNPNSSGMHNFSWPTKLILDKNAFSKFVALKYN